MSAPSNGVMLSPADRESVRQAMLFDPWVFSLFVCKRSPKAERHHRPLLYLYTRRAALLCALLDDPAFDGPITEQIRADFKDQKINWRDPAHLPRVQARLRRVNVRMPRSSGKSTFADDGDLWMATDDPDITISIGSKSDPYAFKRIETIGKFVTSPEYAYWFPERVPDDPAHDVTMKAITLKGRTRHVPEATIEGRGLLSQWAGTHYRVNRRDDIVGTESGESSVEDALRHLANLSALRDHTGWVGDTIIGTVNGEEDDHTMLASDPTVLSVVVAIEEHEGGTTLDNIYDEGTLLMPEWFDRETVNDIKAEAKSNPKYGAPWLMQNFYMAAHKSGTSIFSARMIDRAKFEWFYSSALKREIIRRPKKGLEKLPRKNLKAEDWFYFDPLRAIPATAKASAVDQAVSDNGSADRWADVFVCADWEGVYYVLDSLAAHGYANLLGELVPFDKGTNRKDVRGDVGQPAYIGIDSNATQGMTAIWLTSSDQHKAIARKVRTIKSSNERKDLNIRNWIQARMLAGELYVNPRLHGWISEALGYRPYKPDGSRNKSPKDDQLDATWMAMSLIRIPPSPETSEEEAIQAEERRAEEAKHYDPSSGYPKDDWFAESMWRVA